MKEKNRIISSILISFGFVFNLLIYAPLEFYFLNIYDFWFPIKFILPTIIIVSSICFIILFFILQKTSEKRRMIISKIIFGLFLCLYIQGNFLNLGYGQLNGTEIDWKNSIMKGMINSIIWIIIFVFPFIIKPLNKEKTFNKISSIVTTIIISIETLTLSFVIYFNYFENFGISYELSKNQYLDQSKMFSMSEDENILLIVADSIESDFVKAALEECPELNENLSDFTFFDNATGVSWITYMSMPTMMTGEKIDVGLSLQDNVNNCFNNSKMYDVLSKEGFETEIYCELAILPTKEKEGLITNKVKKTVDISHKAEIKLTNLLYECVFYKYMPHFAKPLFYLDTQDFSKVDGIKVNAYFENDLNFNKNLVETGIDTNLNNKSFKIIKLEGAHSPHNMTTDLEYDNSSEYLSLSEYERNTNEVIASLKILSNYISELKKAGVYDNTTIIWTSDHGRYNRFNPALMIKRKNETNEEMITNSAPISFLEDFTPTILNLATDSKDYGKDVYDYDENIDRNRKLEVFTFTNDAGGRQYLIDSKIVLGINGKASDGKNYYILDEKFADSDKLPEKEYKIGKELKLNKNIKNNKIVLSGISISGMYVDIIKTGSTLGNNATMTLMPEKTDKDVNVDIEIDKVHNKDQKIIIYVNGQQLYEGDLKLNQKNGKISFKIPKDIWNQNKYLKLEYEFPNVEWDESTNYILDDELFLAFSAIDFKSIKFSK